MKERGLTYQSDKRKDIKENQIKVFESIPFYKGLNIIAGTEQNNYGEKGQQAVSNLSNWSAIVFFKLTPIFKFVKHYLK